jgi:hypothetical protein
MLEVLHLNLWPDMVTQLHIPQGRAVLPATGKGAKMRNDIVTQEEHRPDTVHRRARRVR